METKEPWRRKEVIGGSSVTFVGDEQQVRRFHRKHSQAVKGNSRFCSRSCYQNWQRGKPKGAAA